MKIVFLESGSGFGGSSKCLCLLLKHLKSDIKPVVLYYNFGPNIDLIQKSGIKIERCSFLSVLSNILESDLVYINNEIYSHFLNIILSKILYRKCICHVRGIRPLTRREKFLAKWVDRFIAVSNTCKENLIKEGIPATRIQVIYDGIEQALAETYQKTNPKIKVGVVGRISREKGQDVFIKAAKEVLNKYKDIEFLVIGDDAQVGKLTLINLKSLVQGYRLDEVVSFSGWKTDVKEIYRELDIIVCPSLLREALGNVVIEAMAFAKPIVASNIGAYPEMIQDGINGLLFEPGNSNDLAQKIELLLSDLGLRKRLSEKAHETAKEKFDIKINVSKVEALINEVINEARE